MYFLIVYVCFINTFAKYSKKNMQRNKLWYLKLLMLLAAISYFIAVFLDYKDSVDLIRAISIPLFLILLIVLKNKEYLFLGLFFILFSISDFIYIFMDFNEDISYFTGNIMYVLSYISLFIYLLTNINFKEIFKKFFFYILVLIIVMSYLLYSLDRIMDFDVYADKLSILDYLLNSAYNFVILLILVCSFLRYLFFMTKKSLLLFAACFCLSFCELIDVAILFIENENVLNLSYSVLLLIGFYFFYKHIVFIAVLEGDKGLEKIE